MDVNARDLLILAAIPGVGAARLRSLVNHFGGTTNVLAASARELSSVELIDRKTSASIISFLRGEGRPEATRRANAQLSKLNRFGGRLATLWDEYYPRNLKRIYDPPPFLFMSGLPIPDDDVSIAVVGTRSPSPYGTHLAASFTRELIAHGFSVISGLARGIDTIAHNAALKAGGRTIAVIGSGLDVCYPPENSNLADKIALQGAVVSEFFMGAQPDAVNFPRRNRIISGIALGTLVVETGREGGAMITASCALEQNREVFALPCPLGGSRPIGGHLLIKEGRAKLTESVEDIVAELHPSLARRLEKARTAAETAAPRPELTLFEQKVLDAIGRSAIHVDAIALATGLSTSEVLVELLTLELKGIVRQQPGKIFSANH